ncbi:MAG TPA: LPS-assembly protein LptD [Marinagarivorans sp.]
MPNPNACDNAKPSKSTASQALSTLRVAWGRLPAALGAMIITAGHGTVAHAETAAQMDWQPRASLSPEQTLNLRPACQGAYVDPFANAPKPDPANTIIELDAGSADVNETHIELGSGVRVQQGPRLIQAEHMLFNKATEKAAMTGDVFIRQTGSLIKGETASVNMVGNEAEFTNGSFVAHETHMRGTAGRLAHEANGKLVLENGTFTSCEPNDKAWLLSGKSLTIDPNAMQGYGRDVVIYVGGLPVLYTPYIRFPIGSTRQSGLLTPSIGTVDGGLDFAQPWYWNIAPNQDATITPRYVAGRGAMLELEYRYLGHSSENIAQLATLPDDQGGLDGDEKALVASGQATEAELNPHSGESRWLMQFDHRGGFQQPWYSNVDYGKVSDIDFLRELPAASFSVANETYLTQSASLGYDFTNWHISANLYNAQNLLVDVDDSYRRLPQIQAEGNYRLGDFGTSLYHEYVSFDHRDNQRLNGNTIITGDRLRLDYQLNYQRDTSWGFIQPSMGVQGMGYNLDETQLRADADDQPSLSTHYASLDSGLVFENTTGQATIEPRLFYLFRQYTDHDKLFNVTEDGQDVNFDTSPLTFGYDQLFRKRRFTGGDRLDDANQLTLGLTHRYFRSNGAPLWAVSLGQLFYFDDRRVGLNEESDTSQESDIAGQFSAYVSDHVRTLGSVQYNPKTKKLMRASYGLHYAKDNWLFNLGYRYAREQQLATGDLSQRIDQLDLSFFLPAGNQWRFLGRSFYDIDQQRELETFIGFEYDSCCYRIRTVARRWLDAQLALTAEDDRPYDQGLFFEIELFGLGSSGKRIENLLKDSIFGYDQDR